jgi:hypothetical protein
MEDFIPYGGKYPLVNNFYEPFDEGFIFWFRLAGGEYDCAVMLCKVTRTQDLYRAHICMAFLPLTLAGRALWKQ